MDKHIIYLKEVSSYNDVLKKNYEKMPLCIKKIIFLYKNIFNIITKKKLEDKEVWILPIKEKYIEIKIKKIIKKKLINSNNIYVVSNELKENNVCKIMEQNELKHLSEEKIKKILLIDILKYITDIQKKEISTLDITILVNNASELNLFLIEKIAQMLKSLKIVSLNIYKFKKIEEKLYNEYGIAIQFSNSYKKSLEKSKIIINLDFNELQINEYEIFNNAIIINCIENYIKIKSRLFNGIIINSCDIGFRKELVNKFKKMHIYESYEKIILYSSFIENESDFTKTIENTKSDKIIINSLIGNNGQINKSEFKKLDKSKKTE